MVLIQQTNRMFILQTAKADKQPDGQMKVQLIFAPHSGIVSFKSGELCKEKLRNSIKLCHFDNSVKLHASVKT